MPPKLFHAPASSPAMIALIHAAVRRPGDGCCFSNPWRFRPARSASIAPRKSTSRGDHGSAAGCGVYGGPIRATPPYNFAKFAASWGGICWGGISVGCRANAASMQTSGNWRFGFGIRVCGLPVAMGTRSSRPLPAVIRQMGRRSIRRTSRRSKFRNVFRWPHNRFSSCFAHVQLLFR